MATLTTRINGRKVTQGQDIYGIPFVSVEAPDHSGYETQRFPSGFGSVVSREELAHRVFVDAQGEISANQRVSLFRLI